MTRPGRHMTPPDFERIVSLVADLAAATVVVDVEPLIVSWDTVPGAEFASRATRLCALLKDKSPAVSSVVFASNARKEWAMLPQDITPPATVVRNARKPWRTSYLRGSPRPIVVLGDQFLTDGLLAWRTRAIFVQVEYDTAVPLWPRIQHLIGRPMAGLFFRRGSTESGDNAS